MSLQNNTTNNNDNDKRADYLIQYIILRKDLKWPSGALMAQVAHASTSAIHLNYTDELTQLYLKDLDRMHKCVLGIDNSNDLEELSSQLQSNNIKFKLWIEQPENIATCLATKPYYKSNIENLFKKFKLFK